MTTIDTNSAETDKNGKTSRRTVLLGAGAVGAGVVAAGALAACGGNSGPGTAKADPTASKDLGPTSAIPVNGGKVFQAQNVVVTQPAAGTFKAFSATCTHQGCQVGMVSNGIIQCPCHGSEYSILDGSVKQGPAPRPLPPATITVTNGDITLS